MPTEVTLSLSSSAEQEKKNMMKVLRVKIRTGRQSSAIAVTGKTDLSRENLLLYYNYYILLFMLYYFSFKILFVCLFVVIYYQTNQSSNEK